MEPHPLCGSGSKRPPFNFKGQCHEIFDTIVFGSKDSIPVNCVRATSIRLKKFTALTVFFLYY